jgi:hypothetical protein
VDWSSRGMPIGVANAGDMFRSTDRERRYLPYRPENAGWADYPNG